jgi:hypothetical protein
MAKYKFQDIFDKSVQEGLSKMQAQIEKMDASLRKMGATGTGKDANVIANISKQTEVYTKKISQLEAKLKAVTNIEKSRTAEQKRGQRLLKTANKEADKYNRAIQERDQAEKQLANSIRKAAREEAKYKLEMQELQRLQQKRILSDKELSRLASLLAKKRANMVVQTKAQRAEYNKLTVQIADYNKKLKDSDASIGRFQRNVGNYKSAFQGLMGTLGIAGGVAGAVQLLTNQFRKLNEAYNESMKVNENLRQSFGLTGDVLYESTAQVQAISKTFNVSNTEIMDSARALAKTYNIDVADALEMIRDGFLAGSNASGEFMSILREYPVQFRDTGASAEEFMAITNLMVREGIYSDKGVGAIKEGGIRLREMTAATEDALKPLDEFTRQQINMFIESGRSFEAIQLVSEALDTQQLTAKETQTIIADVFGGDGEDAGIEYLKMLHRVDLSMQENADSASELTKRQLEYNQITERINANLTKSDSLWTRTKILMLDLKIAIAENTVAFSDWLSGLYDSIAGLSEFRLTTESIVNALKSVSEEVSNFITSLSEAETYEFLNFLENTNDELEEMGEDGGLLDKVNIKLSDLNINFMAGSKLSEGALEGLIEKYREFISVQTEEAKNRTKKRDGVVTDSALNQFREQQELEAALFEQRLLQREKEGKAVKFIEAEKKAFQIQQQIELLDFVERNSTDLTQVQVEGIRNTILALEIEYQNLFAKLTASSDESANEVLQDWSHGLGGGPGVEIDTDTTAIAQISGLTEEEIGRVKTAATDLAAFVVDSFDQILSNRTAAYDTELDRINELIEKDEERLQTVLESIQVKQDAGAAYSFEQLEQIEAELEAERQREKELREERRKSAKLQQGVAIGEAIINTAVAVTKALENKFPLNLILAALVAAQGAAEVATISSQRFAKGTEYVDDPTAPRGTDTINAWVNRGERIVPTQINESLKGISNSELPIAAELYRSIAASNFMPENINRYYTDRFIEDDRQLNEMQKHTLFLSKMANNEQVTRDSNGKIRQKRKGNVTIKYS